MTIKSRIEAIAAKLNLNFNYGTSYDFNINADYALFPCIVLLEPDDLGFTVNLTSGNVNKKTTTFIQFLGLTDPKVNIAEQAQDRLLVIEAMVETAALFVNEIINDANLLTTSSQNEVSINGIVLRDKYDAHAHGVEIQIGLSLVYPEDVCIS